MPGDYTNYNGYIQPWNYYAPVSSPDKYEYQPFKIKPYPEPYDTTVWQPVSNGWVCPLCGGANGPAVKRCPCSQQKAKPKKKKRKRISKPVNPNGRKIIFRDEDSEV